MRLELAVYKTVVTRNHFICMIQYQLRGPEKKNKVLDWFPSDEVADNQLPVIEIEI